MMLDITNGITFFIASVIGLISCCIQFQNKRVTLQGSPVLNFFQLTTSFYVIFEIYKTKSSPIFSIIIVGLIVVITYVIGYFFGTTYGVDTKEKDLLIKITDAAIYSTMSSKAEQEECDDKIIFNLNNDKGKIIIKDTETINGKHLYSIKFKKWKHGYTKKQIIGYIDAELTNFDYVKPKQIKNIISTMVFAVFVIVCTGLVSESIMNSERYDLEKLKMPDELYFVLEDYECNDKNIIKKIHSEIQDLHTFKDDKLTLDKIKEKANLKYIIEYGHDGNVIYMHQDWMYMYVKYSSISEKSIFHELCYKIHKIYDKSDGVFYRVWYDEELYNYIKDIIKMNRKNAQNI